jgi:nitrite reductase/ring-hydroxylating ferredoxin subunit
LPVTLDLNDDNFFTFDQAYLQCHMHGAMYEIETGYCIGGPCLGARLDILSFVEVGEELHITVPESAADRK